MSDTENTLAMLAEMTGAEILATIENPFQDQFNEMAKGSWLPRLQLEGSNSTIVKMDKIGKGHYALHTGKDQFFDMGKNVECLVICFRPKATDLSDLKKILTSFNHKSELYKRIAADAESKDKELKKSKMYGLEFLLYLPDGPEGKKFCTLHMGNATARFEVKNFRSVIKKPARLSVQVINNGTHVWEAIRVNPLTRDIQVGSVDELMATSQEFLHPPADTVETVDEPVTEETRG